MIVSILNAIVKQPHTILVDNIAESRSNNEKQFFENNDFMFCLDAF